MPSASRRSSRAVVTSSAEATAGPPAWPGRCTTTVSRPASASGPAQRSAGQSVAPAAAKPWMSTTGGPVTSEVGWVRVAGSAATLVILRA